MSIGIALLSEELNQAEALVHRAGLALYRAKNNGRGRVEVFTADMATAG